MHSFHTVKLIILGYQNIKILVMILINYLNSSEY